MTLVCSKSKGTLDNYTHEKVAEGTFSPGYFLFTSLIRYHPSDIFRLTSYIIAPMHDVVPSAVSAAVRMDITI